MTNTLPGSKSPIVNNSIKLAYHIPSGKIIHIDTAENGKSCNCKCLKCNENLIAVQGELRDKHFRHDTDINCNGSQETALHLLGKQILMENNQVTIPSFGIINYSDPFEEKELFSSRPDVSATYNEQFIYFEIAVTHFIEKNKEAFFTKGQHKCVEIVLSESETTSYGKIKNLVLNETSNKKLFGWEQPVTPQQSDNNWFLKISVFIGLYFIVRWLFSKNRR